MRKVSLILDSRGLAGYRPSFLKLVHGCAPCCLRRITLLTIIITKKSHHFAYVLQLFSVTLLVFLGNMNLLQPLQHAKSLQHLAVSSCGSNKFWSCILTFWINFISIHFTEKGVEALSECQGLVLYEQSYLKLVEALEVPHFQKLNLLIVSPERENVFTMLHTEIIISFGDFLTDLSVGIAYPVLEWPINIRPQ